MKFNHRLSGILFFASVSLSPSFVMADTFPDKTITIINPYAPGGNADLQSRFIAEFMEKDLGVTVNVQNRSGGAGAIGMNFIKSAKPTGYTIGITAIGPALVTPNRVNTGYDSTTDFSPIAQITNSPYTLSGKRSINPSLFS